MVVKEFGWSWVLFSNLAHNQIEISTSLYTVVYYCLLLLRLTIEKQ